MDEKKRQKLEKAGWQVGSTDEFLDLSPEEEHKRAGFRYRPGSA
jgi:hypothetical protein